MSDYQLPFQAQLVDRAALAVSEVAAGGESQGILLIGPSGVGKTHALDLLAQRYAASTAGAQRVTPCVRLQMSAKTSAASTSRAILLQLHRPLPARRPPDNHEALAHDALRAQDTRLVIGEKYHNAMLADTSGMRKQNADYLKNLWNLPPSTSPHGWSGRAVDSSRHSLVIVASGIDALLRAFLSDSELRSRFGTVIEAPQVGLYPPERFRDFRFVLRSMTERHGLGDLISANDSVLATQLLIACESHLRVLSSLLERTATLAKVRGVASGASPLLAEAYLQRAMSSAATTNPFEMSEEDLAKVVRQAQHDFKAGVVREARRGRGS